jgi:hypothetical protein
MLLYQQLKQSAAAMMVALILSAGALNDDAGWTTKKTKAGRPCIVSRTTSSWHAGIYLDTQEGRHVAYES